MVMSNVMPLLKANDIEVKVKQVTQKGAIALLYKTSRVDMAVLDEVFGVQNWECDYKEIKGNLYCGIGARTAESEPFVWKWDCGIESREDNEGNQKKGEASDAFKRAGFKWGIGRELYTSPFIFIPAQTKEKTVGNKKTYELANPYIKYDCTKIEYNENREICNLEISDSDGNTVFRMNQKGRGDKAQVQTKTDRTGLLNALINGSATVTMERIISYCQNKFKVSDINALSDEQFEAVRAMAQKNL